MKHILTIFFVGLSALGATAQCISGVTGNALIITNDTVITGNGFYWICPGNTVTLNGGLAWIEEDCTITVNGGSGQYWVDHDCNVTLNGSNHTVRYDATTTITDNSTASNLNLCAQVVINSTFPGGCATTAVSDRGEAAQLLALFPNPATDRVALTLPHGERLLAVRIFDLHGRDVLRAGGTNMVLDVSALPAGCYLLDVQSDRQRHREQLIIR